MAKTGKVRNDELFKGLTRIPTIFGISYNLFFINLLLGMMLMVLKLFILLPGCVVIFLVSYIVSKHEPLFMELLSVKLSRCNFCTNKSYYGGNSYALLSSLLCFYSYIYIVS
ncbi:MAG: VirB3 family type IV secretion system protein [Anaplasmataceae bacterium]|nr:VirB3 family type IV secretion system protein [Anaplasmataceae bacterium]